MELVPEYRREAYHNYIVFKNQLDNQPESNKMKEENTNQEQKKNDTIDWNKVEKACIKTNKSDCNNLIVENSVNIKQECSYELKMLQHNKIPNLLCMHVIYVNNLVEYLYDITAKQTLKDWVERTKLTRDDCIKIYESVFNVIAVCNEYLLDCSHLLLIPEYIYYELESLKCYFIYYADYQKNLMVQINELTEYIMNQINYEEAKAVLLIYGLYHESKKKESSIAILESYFNNKKNDSNVYEGRELVKDNSNDTINSDIQRENIRQEDADRRNTHYDQGDKTESKIEHQTKLWRRQLVNPPVMERKKEEEKLTAVYPIRCYLVLGVAIVIVLTVVVVLLTCKVDRERKLAITVLILSIFGYVMSKVFSKEKKVEKVVSIISYEKPKDVTTNIDSNGLVSEFDYIQECVKKEQVDSIVDSTEYTQVLSVIESNDDCTDKYMLEPHGENQFQTIKISSFPYFIGKLSEGMDATIDNTTISRIHAKIIQEDAECYLTDLGSTNGTYVNDESIEPHTRIKLKDGDLVRFANLEYVFKSY